MLNLGKCLWNGATKLIEAHDDEDAGKCGSLRAGNAGMLCEDEETGSLIAFGGSPGACLRKTYLRFLGIQEVITPERVRVQRMFDQGVASENSFRERLIAGLPEGYSTLKEEDTPIRWRTEAGIEVTGRPDLAIINPNGAVCMGVENKCMSSLWTTTKVVFKALPKTDHLIQAAHYSWQLGIPYELWYSTGSNFALPKPFKYLPKQGEMRSEFMGFWEDGRASSINTPEVGYKLRFNDAGYVEWFQVNDCGDPWSEEWTTSIVSIDRIKMFYEFLASMQTSGLLGPRPESFSADGKEAEYSPCKYCKLEEVCNKSESKGLVRWLKEVLKRTDLVVDRRLVKK